MSDWKEDANKRKDIRNAKDPEPQSGSVKAPLKKKDTKRWCLGKEGKEHDLVCVKYNDVKSSAEFLKPHYEKDRLLICSKCGKEIAIYNARWSKKEKPDWVDK